MYRVTEMENEIRSEDDLPDDFFDEFSNADFINGLNVMDTWNGEKHRVLEDDVRDLIRSRKEEAARGFEEDSRLGNRRDLSKVNRDIKKDKESKVKEHISKRLDSASGPPGTELDDYDRIKRRRPSNERRDRINSHLNGRKERRLPVSRHSPMYSRHSPLRPHYRSQKSRLLISPGHRHSSHRRHTRSPSPRRSSGWRCSRSRSHHRSRSPRRSRSKSPRRSRSRSRSSRPSAHSKKYPQMPKALPLFPSGVLNFNSSSSLQEPFAPPFTPHGYPTNPDGYYPQGGMGVLQPAYYAGQDYSYPGGYQGLPGSVYFSQAAPPMVPMAGSVSLAPQPVPVPVGPQPHAVVPPPVPPFDESLHCPATSMKQHADSLDQLLEDGKISKEDYLKLKPKSRPNAVGFYLKEKVKVLSRCHEAVSKLAKLHLPNRLIISNMTKIPEHKAITSKYCSPLKRQPIVVFNFTSGKSSSQQANKQLVESIIATIGLQEVVAKPLQKENSKFKDVSCQTTTPFCEACEIRQLTKSNEKGTAIEHNHFSNSVHTQVIEAELAKSKSMFTPVGNSEQTGAISSISHLTPAQLIVSQLVARAKKLEQHVPEDPDEERYMRRSGNPHSSYYDSQGYQNNYRY